MTQCERHGDICETLREIKADLKEVKASQVTILANSAAYIERSSWFKTHLISLYTMLGSGIMLAIASVINAKKS